MTLALSIYLRANVPNKVIACFAETGHTEKIVLYLKKVGYSPDYVGLLQHVMRTNPEKGAEFSTQLVNDESGPSVDVERVVDIHVPEHDSTCHFILVGRLKENKQEQGHLQTRLLEMNLVYALKSRTPSSATRCSPTTTVPNRQPFRKGWFTAKGGYLCAM